jgi:serine/threonine protein kinase
MAGVVFFLLVVGVGVIILRSLPRRVARKVLHAAALFLIGVVIVVLFRAITHGGHLSPPAWVFCFLLLCALTYLFIRGVRRLFGLASPGAGPAAFPPTGRLKDFLAERLSHPQGGWRFGCLSTGRLKDFLAERLSPAEHGRVAAHLEFCKACQRRVEGLTAGHKSWSGLARQLSDRPPSPGPALRRVIESLKGEPEQEATRDEPRFAGDLPLGFLSPSDKPGQLGRLDRYEVLEEIGRGGMGVVLKAFDPSLHRVVAIKVLAPQLATSGVARKRFLREARAAAAVTHEHIVTIHAVDEANGLPYLVMQYVPGLSLQGRIDKEGPLELQEVLRIGMQTASGLAAAHAQGIIHRDIKPANILLEDGVQRVKITDFGLARAMDDASLTQSGFVAGSPQYMAPEQARGEALDHRADLFSLGSVVYTMCTGRPPFRAANTLAVLRRVTEDTPRPIRETNPEVPDWLAALVDKLHAKDPAERYQSAAEVVEVFGQHLAALQHAAWVPPPAPSPQPPGGNAQTPGLLTSLTVCPSCGAHLHVPERMVGSLVHCAECGKPFRVEEGSEEIRVARAVPPPFGPQARVKMKLPVWARVLIGCAALLLLFVFLVSLHAPAPMTKPASPYMGAPTKSPDTRAMKKDTGPVTATIQGTGAEPFWKGSLRWFPGEATLFGALDLRAFGSPGLDDARTQTVLGLALPPAASKGLTPENLGRVRLDGVSFAYYEDPKRAKDRAILQFEGLALDGHKRALDSIRQASPGAKVEEDSTRWPPYKLIRVTGPDLPAAVGIFDDHRVFLAGYVGGPARGARQEEVLGELSWFDFTRGPLNPKNVLDGYNPPWLQAALGEMPPGISGFVIGDIPAGVRNWLTEALGLRVCPRNFVLSLQREGEGVALSVTLNVERTGADLILLEDLEKWRRQGLDVLQARFPVLRAEPEALALVGHTLKTMRWGAERGSVRTHVQVPGPTWQALAHLLKLALRQQEGRT